MKPLRDQVIGVPAALDRILERILAPLHADAALVAALGDDRDLAIVTAIGLSSDELERLAPAVEHAVRREEAWSGAALQGNLVPGDEQLERRALRMLLVPLVSNKLDGVICVLRSLERGPFDQANVDTVFALSDLIASLLEVATSPQSGSSDEARLHDLQNTFVSIVSHELQTPVAIIKGYAGALRRPDAAWSPAVVQRVAATIENECDRLTRLITDLLDLARIQAGRVAMTFRPVDLAELLTEVVERARSRDPSCEIVLEDVRHLPTTRGDHDKLRMALNNLVENAVKYSPRGGVISLGGAARANRVRIWVRDQGIGVPAAERERIFERFHRVDSSLSRETPGVGMGLYICKVIVEAHNGRVWVESEGSGRGSTFYIQLPLVTP
jgi:signal transduction histidine kinase